jgi:hypothetical protein
LFLSGRSKKESIFLLYFSISLFFSLSPCHFFPFTTLFFSFFLTFFLFCKTIWRKEKYVSKC